ncbi:hypothetical protein BCR43DRAFT_497064 [Syncephalastrum racemosum]|uniref:Uncharacterized protein n=1 Tax=Syncephalastrum racemosum TaxID=13706 RepID=A0A1X2H545_SYNRA|nr:hypothetical protein BCR43DRAFT_497064 [Syncephalastrum racemosum]
MVMPSSSSFSHLSSMPPFFHPRPCVLMLHMRFSGCLGLLVHFIMLLPKLIDERPGSRFYARK